MLTLKGVHVGYGSVAVIKGVDLHVPAGAIITLIGANGAGKTTLLNTISGVLRPSAGEIHFRGKRIDGLPPDQVVRRRLVHVPEGRKVFRNLTVHECLQTGAISRSDRASVQQDIAAMYSRFPRLGERRAQLAGTLSGGEQQMLAFGRALVAKPDLLLLDEPSMGLAPMIVQSIAELIAEIRGQGVTILLIEQNAELALRLADFGHVLDLGAITLSGTGAELLANDAVRASYLGA
jgi:branched-chain amino acid transport system ATP-binding protein